MAELSSDLSEVGSVHRRPHSLGRHRSERMLSLVSGLVGGRGGAESLAVFAFQFVRDSLFSQVAPVIESVRVSVDEKVPRTPHSFVRGHRVFTSTPQADIRDACEGWIKF